MSEGLFDTGLLDAALGRRREAAEYRRRQVVEQVFRFLDRWGRDYGIRQAYLFGSVARAGCFGAWSDVDLAVEQIDHLAVFRAAGHLSSEIGRPVDLVELADCPFAKRIRSEGIPWNRPA